MTPPARRPLPQRITVATNNRGKLREIAAMLSPLGIEVVAASAVVPGWTIDETGETFAENARAKAVDLSRRAQMPALGDDSGLVVDALGGRPCVRSARYAGEHATDAENVAKLLDELAGVAPGDRRAAFRCALALAWPDGALVEVEADCEGTIALAPSGSSGFGYDSVFVDPASGRTFAELDDDAKNARSHRGRALALLRDALTST